MAKRKREVLTPERIRAEHELEVKGDLAMISLNGDIKAAGILELLKWMQELREDVADIKQSLEAQQAEALSVVYE